MPRGRNFPDVITSRHVAGTCARIAAVLADGETEADAVREAVLLWLEKREGKGP